MTTPRGVRALTACLTAGLAVALIVTGAVLLLDGPDESATAGPDVAAQQAQAALVQGIERDLADPAPSPTSFARTRAQLPKRRPLASGVWSLVTVPRLGLRVPVRGGTDAQVLATGLGHWQNGVGVGRRGNFVLAGHRVTHTEPFAAFPTLRSGDRVLVRTSNAVYTYVLDTPGTDLRVDQHALWVTGPHPAGSRTRHVITLITCAETFHTDDRSVVFGHLVKVQPTR
ncbi:class E sortase [Nocardioides sp. CN2-186]|uniref:class E sortase n=1 Tax=Nocardioides tweenelious TaxID=3156607 RepID=UPI0032B60997